MYILQECVGLSLGYVRLVLVLQSTPIFKYYLTSNKHRLGTQDEMTKLSLLKGNLKVNIRSI